MGLKKGKIFGRPLRLGVGCKTEMVVEEVGMDEAMKDPTGPGKDFGFYSLSVGTSWRNSRGVLMSCDAVGCDHVSCDFIKVTLAAVWQIDCSGQGWKPDGL